MKRYFIKDVDSMESGKTLIIIDEEDMETEFCLGNVFYTDNIEDITSYKLGYDDTIIDEEEAKGIYFIDPISVTEKIADLIKNYEGDIEYYNNNEDEKLTQKEVEEFITYMKENSQPGTQAITEKVWNYWDGSNWQRYVLETDGDFCEWIDITDEMEDMEEIDEDQYNTGVETLYRLQNGDLILIDNSFYQGSLWIMHDINKEVETVEEARELLYN